MLENKLKNLIDISETQDINQAKYFNQGLWALRDEYNLSNKQIYAKYMQVYMEYKIK